MKSLLKKYKSAPRGEAAPSASQEPSKTPQHQYLHDLWKQNTSSTSPVTPSSGFFGTGLGLLFIIIDDLPHEWIWRTYIHLHDLQQSGLDKKSPVRVWIHAKYPLRVQSPWVRAHLVNFCIRAEWGSIELTKIMVRLLSTAYYETEISSESSNDMKIEDCNPIGKFCFVSESCLPTSLPEPSLQDITEDNTSWMKWTRTPNNGYAKQGQFDVLAVNIPAECVTKADQWLLINRQHARGVIELVEKARQEKIFNDSLFGLFKRVHASDEMFFPTCFSLLGFIPSTSSSQPISADGEVTTCNLSKKRVTFCNWTEDNARNPMIFKSLIPLSGSPQVAAPPNMYAMAKAEGCVFMRKLNVPETYDTRKAVRREVLCQWLSLVMKAAPASLHTLQSLVNDKSDGAELNTCVEDSINAITSQCCEWVNAWEDEVVNMSEAIPHELSIDVNRNIPPSASNNRHPASHRANDEGYHHEKNYRHHGDNNSYAHPRAYNEFKDRGNTRRNRSRDESRDRFSGSRRDRSRDRSRDRDGTRDGNRDRTRKRSRERNRDRSRSRESNMNRSRDSYSNMYQDDERR